MRARTTRAPASVALALLLVAASPSRARDVVRVESDPQVDLARFGSFAVVLGTSWGSPICERRSLAAIERELEASGRSKSDEATADLLVVVHGTTREKTALHAFYSAWPGWGWRGWGPGAVSTHSYEYTERTLVVDAFRREGKLLVWRASARGVAAPDPQRSHARLEKAIRRMFAALARTEGSDPPQGTPEQARP